MSTLFHCVNTGTMSVVCHRKNVLWLCCVYEQWHCHWKTVPRNRLLDGKCWKIEAAFQESHFTWISGKIFLTPTTSTTAITLWAGFTARIRRWWHGGRVWKEYCILLLPRTRRGRNGRMWQPTLHLPVVSLRMLTSRHTTYIKNLVLPRLPQTQNEERKRN